jgi:alkaline phosphatase D
MLDSPRHPADTEGSRTTSLIDVPEDPMLRWAYVAFAVCTAAAPAALAAELGMGIRVGEVTPTTAVVWTRVTRDKARLRNGYREPADQPIAEPAEVPIDTREGAMPGAPGEVRLHWSVGDNPTAVHETEWITVTPEHDFCHQFKLNNLPPNDRIQVRVEAKSPGGDSVMATASASFQTSPNPTDWRDVRFTMLTCQGYTDLDHADGYEIYPVMQQLQPDFVVSAGDNVYLDEDPPRAKSVDLARHHWHRMYSLPRHVEFFRSVPGYWLVDDHDSWFNDCWPQSKSQLMSPLTFEEGFGVFREQVPIGDEPTFRTRRWGQGLQIWMVEGREFRSPNSMADGPAKSIWGVEQREQLMESILASDAEFKVLVSPTPIVGPDRERKTDNHANASFAWEGNLFRDWTAEHKLDNLFVVCGDRHWQYFSIDPRTKLHEFSCGPTSDAHASGSPGQDSGVQPYHRVQGGFLEVAVTREEGHPTICFRHRDVHGEVQNEFRRSR